jgi:hypothetical protein
MCGKIDGGVGLAPHHRIPHSIWQIVFHLNDWIEYDLKRIRGECPLYPGHASESWPPDPVLDPASADNNEWKREVTRFRALLGEVEVLANAGSEKMQEGSRRCIPRTNGSRHRFLPCSGKLLCTTATTSGKSAWCGAPSGPGRRPAEAIAGSSHHTGGPGVC